MSKTLSRPQVAQIVLDVVREVEDDPDIKEETRFWEDLRVDPIARRDYYEGIEKKMKSAGSDISGIALGELEGLKSVRDLIDLVYDAQPD